MDVNFLCDALAKYEIIQNAVECDDDSIEMLGFDQASLMEFNEYGAESDCGDEDDNDDDDDDDDDGGDDDDDDDDFSDDSDEGSEYKMKGNKVGKLRGIKKNEGNDANKDGEVSHAVQLEKVTEKLTLIGKTVPFLIGGNCGPSYSVNYNLTMRTPGKGDTFADLGNVHALDVQRVLQFCELSQSGDLAGQSSDVVSLGSVMECKSDFVKLELVKGKYGSGNLKVMNSLRKAVQENLFLDVCEIDFHLCKLTVCSTGGFHKTHTDTPTHDPFKFLDPSNFLGSVVVCLPSAHEGGELVVRHAGQETLFDFATESNNTDIIQFAAFYGDCEHEVRPVTAGHRVTLTYNIMRRVEAVEDLYFSCIEDDMKVKVNVCYGEHEPGVRQQRLLHEVYPQLQKLLGTTGCIGVFLSHDVTDSALLTPNLQDNDKLLYDFLHERSVPMSLVPVVTRHSYEYFSDNYDHRAYFDSDYTASFDVRLLKGFADPRLQIHKDIPWQDRHEMPFLNVWPTGGLSIKDEATEGYYTRCGNEPSSVASTCIVGALIIGPLPPRPPADCTTIEEKSVLKNRIGQKRRSVN